MTNYIKKRPPKKNMVPKAGIEPARAIARRILNPLRIPISPLRQRKV